MMKPTPINMAEAVLEPFWDRKLDALKEWVIEDGTRHGLFVKQIWCYVTYEWFKKPAEGPALSMYKKCQVDCSGYDQLVLSIMGPENATYRVEIQTDSKRLTYEAAFKPFPHKEYVFSLSGASRIEELRLCIFAGSEGTQRGWINWIGLQNSILLERYIEQYNRFDEQWKPYLQPETFSPAFRPYYGIIANDEELEGIRQKHENYMSQGRVSPFVKGVEDAWLRVPEKLIRDYVNIWEDTQFCRERDIGRIIMRTGVNAAVAGILLRDKNLLRLAARYALSIAMCEHWNDGMICNFPGGIFEHRCFDETLCVHEIGQIMDLAGEMFTDVGREFLLRRLAEEGLGRINFITWKHEYIFDCNQLAWFSLGRMMGYAVLMKHQPRVKPYMELAYNDIAENFARTILPDGGYAEGPDYYGCVGGYAGPALYYYARSMGIPFKDIIPEAVLKAGDFAETLMSTDEESDFIPICDGSPIADIIFLAVMAAVLPQTHWTTLYRKAISRRGGMGDNLLAIKLDSEIPCTVPEMKPLLVMPDVRLVASVRKFDSHTVKLFIMSNRAGVGHNHEDKGSFVLEFAGQTFAMDPGSCDYSSPLMGTLQTCQRHNMLVPMGTLARPRPQNPLLTDLMASCTGDDKSFSATLDASAGWEDYYSHWVRAWDSPSPDVLIIEDRYELKQGCGVEFYWNTMLDVEILKDVVMIQGRWGKVMVQIPENCSARLDILPLFGGKLQKRIAFACKEKSGRICVKAHLETCSDG